MLFLIKQAREYEDWWRKLPQHETFLHNLQLGIALTDMVISTPCLMPEAAKAAAYLRDISLDMINDTGKVKCWQIQKRRRRKFALKIADLAHRLQRAVEASPKQEKIAVGG